MSIVPRPFADTNCTGLAAAVRYAVARCRFAAHSVIVFTSFISRAMTKTTPRNGCRRQRQGRTPTTTHCVRLVGRWVWRGGKGGPSRPVMNWKIRADGLRKMYNNNNDKREVEETPSSYGRTRIL